MVFVLEADKYTSREQVNRSLVLEVESRLRRLRARHHIGGPSKCGKEVVQRHFVGQINDRASQAPLVAVFVEQVAGADGKVK
jgi:hypothetical protein